MKKIFTLSILFLSFLLIPAEVNAQCSYSLELYDSFGDGWDGATIQVTINSTPIPGSPFTMAGSLGVVPITGLADGDIIGLQMINLGGFQTEHSWSLFGTEGALVQNEPNLVNNTALYNFTANCPPCAPPNGLAVSAITTNSATLSWNPGAGIVFFTEVVPQGLLPGTGNETVSTIGALTTENITGLSPATQYSFWVSSLCPNGTDSVSFIGPFDFVTPGTCGTFELELYDSFGDGWNGGSIDVSINGTVAYPGITLATGSGPESLLIPLNINDIVSIDYIGSNSPGENQYIFYDELGAVIVDEGAAGVPNDLPIYQACPTCPRPTNVVGSGITANSIDLAWTTGGASNWIIEYGPAGYIPGSPSGTTVSAPTNPFTLTGLSPSLLYDVYIIDSCGLNDLSIYSTVFNFGTPCGIIVAPYLQTFDATLALPYCWAAAGADPWRFYSSTGTNTPAPGYGVENSLDHTTGTGNFAWIDASSGIGTNELETPLIDYSGLTQGIVGGWVKSNNVDNAVLNELQIEAFNGLDWDTLLTYSGNFDGWLRVFTLIPAYLPDTTSFRMVQVEGTQTGNSFNNDILFDDFFVQEAPTCLNSVDLVSTILTPTTVELDWTVLGNASNWIIEYGDPGFTPGTGTSITASTVPFVLNVNSGSDYEWYVVDSCSATDLSWESLTDNFRMPGEVNCDTFSNFTYCHPDESEETYTYLSENGTGQLHFVFNSGQLGGGVDFTVYDGSDNTFPVLFTSTGGTNMSGVEFTSNSSIVTFEYNSVNANVCTTPLNFDVNCCVATFASEVIYLCVDSSFTLADGVVVSDAGAYGALIQNVKGCDSIIDYSVFIIPDSTSLTDRLCVGEIYTFADGSTTSVPGQFFATTTNKLGCDSTITYNLTTALPSSATMSTSICSDELPYTLPDGVVVTAAGNYNVIYTNDAGCDSTLTINLNVNQPTVGFQTVQICEGQEFELPDGVTANSAGTYTSVITNINGCDSTVTTNLTMGMISYSDVIIEICGEETYTLLNGDEIGESGEYNISIDNMAGCDSIVTVYVSKCNAIGNLNAEDLLSIYPNPAVNELNIIMNKAVVNNANFKIINAVGQVVFEQVEVSESNMKLNVSNYNNGMYFIVLSDNKTTSLHKFIVVTK